MMLDRSAMRSGNRPPAVSASTPGIAANACSVLNTAGVARAGERVGGPEIAGQLDVLRKIRRQARAFGHRHAQRLLEAEPLRALPRDRRLLAGRLDRHVGRRRAARRGSGSPESRTTSCWSGFSTRIVSSPIFWRTTLPVRQRREPPLHLGARLVARDQVVDVDRPFRRQQLRDRAGRSCRTRLGLAPHRAAPARRSSRCSCGSSPSASRRRLPPAPARGASHHQSQRQSPAPIVTPIVSRQSAIAIGYAPMTLTTTRFLRWPSNSA